MSQFMVIQVGQCGNQLGSGFWSNILQEYQILPSSFSQNKNKIFRTELQESMPSFFNFGQNKKYLTYDNVEDFFKDHGRARAVCIDMEDSVVAKLKAGKYKKLFDPKSLITNYPGSGNNWADGFFHHGPEYKDKILDSIQYNLDKCDSLQGFLLLLSTGGGTGSGLGTYILNLLADYYPDIERIVTCIYPIGTEDVITCPYNMAFATNEMLNSDCCILPIENRALYDIVAKQFSRYFTTTSNNGKSSFKSFDEMNSIVVDMLLHLTSGSRFNGSLNFDINELNTNMVPFPNFNFLSTGYSPLLLKSANSTNQKDEVFVTSCSRNNQLNKLDPLDSRKIILGTTLLGRGDYSITDMKSYLNKIQTKGKFTSWSKHSSKIGICKMPPIDYNFGMLSVFNTTAMSSLFETVLKQFNALLKRKAHVHHYTNISGFDYEHFANCQENLMNVIHLYKSIS